MQQIKAPPPPPSPPALAALSRGQPLQQPNSPQPDPDAEQDSQQAMGGQPDTNNEGEPPNGSMAEEAHWRLDEHNKRINDIGSKLDNLGKAADGMPHALIGLMRVEVEKMIDTKLREFESRDKTEDRKLIRDMFGDLFKQYEDQEVEVTKHGTMETPEGVHKMTVTETRKRASK